MSQGVVEATSERVRTLLAPREAATVRQWLKHTDAVEPGVIERAKLTLEHKTRLLGADDCGVGDPVSWHRDHVTGKIWPRRHFSRIDYLTLGDPCDVKRCWDLSRCYHWVWLAQSSWLTGDKDSTREVARQWEGWLTENPPEIGVNWGNAMEVALRTISWWWVLALVEDDAEHVQPLLPRILGAIIDHARYIERRLETSALGRNSNHLLADYVGLAFAGLLLSSHPDAARWRSAGLDGLWAELDRQVYPDGVQYEQATEYHRFVLEFFLYTAILAERAGCAPPPAAWARIERMLEYSMHMTQPDGLVSSIGDGDDGRMYWLTDRGPADHRGLLAVGAAVFSRGDFKCVAGSGTPAEVAWILGADGIEKYDRLTAHRPAGLSKAFPDGGTYVLRSGWDASATLVVVDAGYLGMGPQGLGSHGHADTLSFTVFAEAQPQLIDPGTFVYTSDVAWRDAFRSTRFHNALTVDGHDICSFHDGPFRWSSLCNPRVERWEEGQDWVVFVGEHDGFREIEPGLMHRRAITLNRRQPVVLVFDEVLGTGVHELDLWFQLGGNRCAEVEERHGCLWCGRSDERALGIFVPTERVRGIDVHFGDEHARLGWSSPSYGKKERASTARVAIGVRELPYRLLSIVASREFDVASLSASGEAESLPANIREAVLTWPGR
jgi:hypothetical protein